MLKMLPSRKCSRSAGKFVRTAMLAAAVAVAAAAAPGCKDSQDDDKATRRSDRRGSVQRDGDDYNYPRVLLRARSMGQATKDRNDIAVVLFELHIYALSHDGKFPPSLDAIAENNSSVRKMLTYEDGQKRFEYVAGLSPESQGDSVIVYEASADQDKKRFVVRVNGVIDLLDEEQFDAAMKR